MKHLIFQKLAVQLLINRLQIMLRAVQQPVGHGLAGQHDILALPILLLAVQRHIADELFRHDMCCRHGRCKAAGNQSRFLFCLYNRRGDIILVTVSASVGVVYILTDSGFGRNQLQRAMNLFTNDLHLLAALRADLLF